MLISVEGLTRTLQKIYAARRLATQVDVPTGHFIRGQREDLEEMLGNLLDNACKGAESQGNTKIVGVDAIVEGSVILNSDRT
jgi:signal transduction histidine kinase